MAFVALAFAVAVAQPRSSRVFTAEEHGFSITVPAGYAVYKGDATAQSSACEHGGEGYARPVAGYGWEHDHPLSKVSLLCIGYPHNAFTGTTFTDAALQAMEVTNLLTVADCESFAPPLGLTLQRSDGTPHNDVRTETIGGLRFSVGSFDGVATTQVSTKTLYRTFQNGRCYEFSTHVVYSDYPGDGGQMKVFTATQEREVRQELKRILLSIQLRKR